MNADHARADLLRLINGFQASQAIHVAATLGLADLLHAGRSAIDELAAEAKAHPGALYRLMRSLASIGVFEERENKHFHLTPMGDFLRTDIAGTHTPMAELIGRPNNWQAWSNLLFAVRTGVTAFDHVHGRNVWDYRAQHPDESRIFNRAMSSGTERFAEAVLNACDFGRFHCVADIGGGDGMFLAKILAEHPRMSGILFDQPHVVAGASASLERLGLSHRCQAIGGNFFTAIPESADAYLLKWILHDWDDIASVDILRSCRRAMKRKNRLLVVEHIIGAPNTSSDGKFMDITMMVMTGGRVRGREEFEQLFDRAGLRLASTTPTATPLCVIEAVLASD